jgi:hypothetical protein
LAKLAWILVAAAAPAAAQTASPVTGDAMPIALHPDNPHYLLLRGKPVVLVTSGEHYGAVLNGDFDYEPYLDELQSHGLNLTRTFTGVYCEPPGAFNIARNTLAPAAGKLLCPFARSDQPGYANGGNRFDLTRWDEAYFRRLKTFVAAAGRRGIVVELVLFCPFYKDDMWKLSPMNAANNVNDIGQLKSTTPLTLNNGKLMAVQEAMVRKIVSELAGADNLYYEICNEPYFAGVTLAWQHRIADTIIDAQAKLRAKHLIAQNIANGKAKIVRPHPGVSIFNFHYATPPDTVSLNWGLNKAIADDETGFKGQADFTYRREGWEFLLAGGAIYSHLDYSFTVDHPAGTFKYPASQPGGGSRALRQQLGILKRFVESFDFVGMKSDDGIVKAGIPVKGGARVLAKRGEAYAIYVHGGHQTTLVLDLPRGAYEMRWISTLTGKPDKHEGLDHTGGQVRLASPPYADDVALSIVRRNAAAPRRTPRRRRRRVGSSDCP